MTISSQSPSTASRITHGAALSFNLDDGGVAPSIIQVLVAGATTTSAWTLAGGFGSGYTGTSVKVGNVYSLSFSKDAGWDASPFTVTVNYTISGTSYTSSWSYELEGEQSYPDLMQPRNALSTGDATLNSIINAASSSNSVAVPGGDPIVLYTTVSTTQPLSVEQRDTSYDPATGVPLLSATKSYVSSGTKTATVGLHGDYIRFSRTSETGSFRIQVDQNVVDDATGHSLYVVAGQAGADVGGGGDGGNLVLRGGTPTGSGDYGRIQLENMKSLRLGTGIEIYEAADHPQTPEGGIGQLWVRSDTPNVLVFTDDAGTDYVLTDKVGTAGTTAQDALLLTERADHVNTPASGKGELWIDSATSTLKFTDDSGTDWVVVQTPGTDSNAVHVNGAAEISALTLVVPETTDHLLIEDASDSNNKKRIQVLDTYTFAASFNAYVPTLPDSTNWYGPNISTNTATWHGDTSWATDWGTGPTASALAMGFCCPVDCTITDFTAAFRFTDLLTPQWERIAVWKFPYINGFAAGTPVQMSTISVVATAAGSVSFPYTVHNAGVDQNCNAGDVLMVLTKNVSGADDFHFRSTVLMRAR